MFDYYVACFSGVFDVLAYTDKDVAVPFTWIESDPKLIANPQMVKLHSFDTKVNIYWLKHIGQTQIKTDLESLKLELDKNNIKLNGQRDPLICKKINFF